MVTTNIIDCGDNVNTCSVNEQRVLTKHLNDSLCKFKTCRTVGLPVIRPGHKERIRKFRGSSNPNRVVVVRVEIPLYKWREVTEFLDPGFSVVQTLAAWIGRTDRSGGILGEAVVPVCEAGEEKEAEKK